MKDLGLVLIMLAALVMVGVVAPLDEPKTDSKPHRRELRVK